MSVPNVDVGTTLSIFSFAIEFFSKVKKAVIKIKESFLKKKYQLKFGKDGKILNKKKFSKIVASLTKDCKNLQYLNIVFDKKNYSNIADSFRDVYADEFEKKKQDLKKLFYLTFLGECKFCLTTLYKCNDFEALLEDAISLYLSKDENIENEYIDVTCKNIAIKDTYNNPLVVSCPILKFDVYSARDKSWLLKSLCIEDSNLSNILSLSKWDIHVDDINNDVWQNKTFLSHMLSSSLFYINVGDIENNNFNFTNFYTKANWGLGLK